MPRASAFSFVCCPRHRDYHAMKLFGQKGGANGHVPLCRHPSTLHGGCVGLRGRWEADGITGLAAFARLCVGGCDVMGTVCGRMPLRATVSGYCVWLLLLLPPPCFTVQIEILWFEHHKYCFRVLVITRRSRRISGIGDSSSIGITIWRNRVTGFDIRRKGFAEQEAWSTRRVRHTTTALLVSVWVGGCGLWWVRVRAASTACGAGPLRLCVRRCSLCWHWWRWRRGCPRRMRWCCDCGAARWTEASR
ncbi:hypothetical protein MOQ_009585, partial [Trypanosoma cruzi marinkellei]